MKIGRYLLALVLTIGLTLPALAQEHYTELDYPPLPDFDVPEATRVELDNGMILFLIEDHDLPLINLSARIGTGSVYEPAEKIGLASITGTVMRTGGTESRSGDEINEQLESIGAVIETNIGETSGSAYMSTLKENVDEVLTIYADVLMNPAFPQEKIDLAKTQQKSAISRRNDNPQQIAFREFTKLVYGADSPYARHTEYATIDAITRDDLVAFHEEFFHPNNTILGAWGDFDTDAMVQRIEAAFADWPEATGFERPDLPSVDTGSDYGVYYASKEDVTQSTVLLGHPGEVRQDHSDYAALTVMNQVLSGGFSSRLFQNVRDDQGLAYAVFGAYTANYDRPGQFYAGVMTKSGTTVEAAESVMNEIEKMQQEPPSDEEMDQAKDSYLNSFVFNFDTRREIVGRMMTYEYYGYPEDFLEQEKEGIEAVNKNDVLQVSKKYLKPEKVKILVVGNDEDFGEPLSTLGEVTELDITIPTGEEEAPEATEETRSRGRELLSQAADVLGGQQAFAAIETVKQTGTTTVTTPDGQQMSLDTEIVGKGEDQARVVQRMPMGEITITINGDEIMMQTPQGTQPAPPPVKEQILSGRWRNLLQLFGNMDDEGLEVQHVGQETVDGQTTEVLMIQPPGAAKSFRLYLDAESKQPVAVSYQGSNPMTGAPVDAREVFSDFREVGDVMLPFQMIQYQDGEVFSESIVDQIQVNVDVDESLFDTGS